MKNTGKDALEDVSMKDLIEELQRRSKSLIVAGVMLSGVAEASGKPTKDDDPGIVLGYSGNFKDLLALVSIVRNKVEAYCMDELDSRVLGERVNAVDENQLSFDFEAYSPGKCDA